MQSQQKRVKWSRGETADALEERTDTGITQASVALMENCIPDIFGNISRRPALKPIPYGNNYFGAGVSSGYNYGFTALNLTAIVPFYITETDYILIGIHDNDAAEFIRIKDGVCVYKYRYSPALSTIGRVYSYAQQNNYLLIAGHNRTVKIQINIESSHAFTPAVSFWEYTAGWYAPNGTDSKTVNTSIIAGLAFHGPIKNYVYTPENGLSSLYSSIDTGVDGYANLQLLEQEIPLGSIVKMPNIGCYMRVEGYYNEADEIYWPLVVFDHVIVKTDNSAPTEAGNVCVARNGTTPAFPSFDEVGGPAYLEYWINGVRQERVEIRRNQQIYVRSSTSLTGYSSNMVTKVKHTSGMTKYYTFEWGTWEDADQADNSVFMYGALLTPVADENGTDSVVSVEYGYISLTPESFDAGASYSNIIYPHAEQLCFCNQRLWAGQWKYQDASYQIEDYAIVLGSQIARYNDFKNDYNQENEPVTLDILTQYKEKIIHLVDYNGLKIFTDSFEYAYNSDGVVKQSGNGALDTCKPIVFESLCLYADKTGNQIRAMQYELQSNIFNSSCINQMAPHDIIWYPVGLASYEDKVYSTGKYLFIANTLHNTTPALAVCNFVPSNQANIWSRWSIMPWVGSGSYNRLYNVLDLKGTTLFFLLAKSTSATAYVPCMLDFTGNTDLTGNVEADGSLIIASQQIDSETTIKLTIPKSQVAVYADGEYKFTTTTDDNGKITDDLTGLTNITAGLIINSKIVSHPIDVGGKTKSVMKRIGKTQMSVRDTEAGAITINGKTGYMNPRGDHICFYGVTGMKDETIYTLTNKNGAMFHLESLLMNIEYGTLDS